MYPFQLDAEPSADLGLSIVIPCFDEPDIRRTLRSLARCDKPGCDVEILVAVNAPVGTDSSVLANNAAALRELADFQENVPASNMRFLGLCHENLPQRGAGVGLARKIGMDEAAHRIARSRRCDGIIASLDADCEVERNFLCELEREFREHEHCPGISIYFEHPILERDQDSLHEAMLNYELHLRYYVLGQRLAGFPYAFHTIGSAMACRAAVYADQGGMNRRQGGEDFYFIQKLIALGGYRALNSTTVYPGVRVSHRVPFGTGRALGKALDRDEEMLTFSPEVFSDLKAFGDAAVGGPASLGAALDGFSPPLRRFLQANRFTDRLLEVERNVATVQAFRKRVFRWFNAFRFMKFAQFASRESYPTVPVAPAARVLAEAAGVAEAGETLGLWKLLTRYRQLDKETATHELFEDSF